MVRRTAHTSLLSQVGKFREASPYTDDIIMTFLSDLDCPRSLSVWLLYKHGEHGQLLELDHPHHSDIDEFRRAYIATEFLSKATFLKTGYDLKKRAFEKFLLFEQQCKKTNIRFRRPALDPLNNGSNVWLLNATRRKIASILGDISAEEFVSMADWGPGVSTLVKGEDTSASNKFRLDNGITRDLYSLVSTWFPFAYPCWFEHLSSSRKESTFDFQVGNRVVTVPKNSKTDRVIAIEPGINLWFQKSIGAAIRRRLRRSGVNLQNQGVNQFLAYVSSRDDHLATVDFSSASDSISIEVVRELLPPRWFQLLDLTRSRLGTMPDGSLIHWEKFSSMGNGFTFELESLIFFAAAQAVCEHERISSSEVSVYGDDVIIPNHCFLLFSSFSEYLGFSVNRQKSFSFGDFRESCGAHFKGGVDCKPIFLKERLRNAESFYKLANRIRNLAHRCNNYYGCDTRFRNSWTHLFERVPEPLRFKVSSQLGDTGFIVNFDEACPCRAGDGIEGFRTLALISVGVTRTAFDVPVMLARLWQPSTQEHGNSVTLRGRTRTSLKRVLVSRWYNLGPWL